MKPTYAGNFQHMRMYKLGSCTILHGIEGGKHHLSISHPFRYPKWEELKTIRYALTPKDVHMVMTLPPPSEYVNIHNNCFHLWEAEDPNPKVNTMETPEIVR